MFMIRGMSGAGGRGRDQVAATSSARSGSGSFRHERRLGFIGGPCRLRAARDQAMQVAAQWPQLPPPHRPDCSPSAEPPKRKKPAGWAGFRCSPTAQILQYITRTNLSTINQGALLPAHFPLGARVRALDDRPRDGRAYPACNVDPQGRMHTAP